LFYLIQILNISKKLTIIVDMKTFKLNTLTLLLLTLTFQGCMPDSLTKFKKETPVKSASTSAPVATVTDSTGETITVDKISPPTYFSYTPGNDLVFKYSKNVEFQGFRITGDNDFSAELTRNRIIKKCSISPSIPAGMGITFDPTNCQIFGTPNQIYTNPSYIGTFGKNNFTVTVQYINSTGSTSLLPSLPITIQIIAAPTELNFTQSPKVLLKVAGDITTFSDLSGPIISDDLKVSSDLAKNTIKGTVETIDKINSVLGVKNLKHYDLQNPSGASYIDANGDSQPDGTGEALKSNYYFKIGNVLDSDTSYYVPRATISSITNIFPTVSTVPLSVSNYTTLQPIEDVTNNINPNDISTRRNYLEFTISPKLPNDISGAAQYFFDIDKYSGKIYGWSKIPLPQATYTVTASNAISSISSQIIFQVIEAPLQYSLTHKQLLTISDLAYSYMKEGDFITSPIVFPKTTSVQAMVTKMIPSTPKQIEVSTNAGSFDISAPFDIGKTFNAIVGVILAKPVNFSAAITTSSAVSIPTSGQIVGDMLLLNTSGVTPISRVYITASGSSAISTGDTVLAPSTISEIDSDTLKMEIVSLNPGGSNVIGNDIVSSDAKTSGYVYDQSATAVYVSDIFRSINPSDISSRNFQQNDNLVFDERSSGTGPTAVISNTGAGKISFNSYFSAERGAYFELQMSLMAGTGVTFSVSPALPEGIVLDTKTGILSGTPTTSSSVNLYVLTAKNLLGVSNFNLKLEVRDFFYIANDSASSATTFNLHKVGDYQNTRKCRINSTDINNGTGILDVRCFMDGEEEDIHFNNLKLTSAAGKGICEYIQVYPYSFWQYAPLQTDPTTATYDYHTGCLATPTETPTPELLCEGNYVSGSGPNCDEGSVKITTHTWTVDSLSVCSIDTKTTYTMKCGGKKTNCLQGPVRDILSDAQIQGGNRAIIYASSEGQKVTSDFTSPISHSDFTNLRIANGTLNNKCSSSIADTDAFSDYVATQNPFVALTAIPFSGGSNPYYQVACLDAAKDIKARIRIIVRNWNRSFRTKDEIDKDNPDSTLALANYLMNPTGSSFGKSYVDHYDWDNQYSTLYAASVNAGSCAVPNYTSKYALPVGGI
jgi:hypothetical protein